MSGPTIALVGCGRWGRFILRDLVALGCGVPVVARDGRSRQNASEGGAERIVASIDELGPVDGAVVATPLSTHAAVLMELLPRGVPIFCEKELTDDLAAAERLLERGDGRIFVMHKWRYHPGIEALAAIARSGELGRVHGVHCTRLGVGDPHSDTDPVWTLLPHDLSIGLEILGRLPEPRAAVAELRAGAMRGMTALLGEAPWLAVEVSAQYGGNRREVRLVCERGVASLADSYQDHVRIDRFADPVSKPLDEPERRAIETEWPLLRELRAFVAHVGGGPPPASSLPDAVGIVRTIVALRRLAGEAPATGPR